MLCFSSAPRKLQVHKCFRIQFIQYCNMICFTPFRRLTVKSHRLRLKTIQNITAKSYPVFEISKIEIKTDECAQEISSYFICFTQQMKVIISCGKSDILKSKQVVSLAKRIFNKFFHCLQSSPPASTCSLQLPFVLEAINWPVETGQKSLHCFEATFIVRYLCFRDKMFTCIQIYQFFKMCIFHRYQVSRFWRETHAFRPNLTQPRHSDKISLFFF